MARSDLVPWAFKWKKLKNAFLVASVLFDTIMHSN